MSHPLLNKCILDELQDISHQALTSILDIKKAKAKQSGFFDLPKAKQCTHPEHEPPKHICIPQGMGYRHVCPGCGIVRDIIPTQITL